VTLSQQAERSALNPSIVWTVREVLEWTTGYFRKAEVSPARFEAELLLAHALHTERLNLYTDHEYELNERERACFRELVKSRRSGTPSAYLLGNVDFMGYELKVNNAVLIPRPETEELVEKILADFAELKLNDNALRIADLGTGSGAIAISLLKKWPNANFVCVDKSEEALSVAKENAESNGVIEKCAWLISDWTTELEGQFDLIVANPPYIRSDELPGLSKEVIENEPWIALDGGSEGLDAIDAILTGSKAILKPGSPLYLEIGHNQGPAVLELIGLRGNYTRAEIFKDLGGRDRIVRTFREEID
jgi:release factor glutamine methyltransferase